MSIDTSTDTTYRQGYRDGVAAQVEVCTQHNLVRIGDVLDIIDRHVGDVEALRSGMLRILGGGR